MSSDMRTLLIDRQEIEVPATYTLMQACEAAGAEIPRFCYHERLSIAGNCRMCLVACKGSPKPVASCAQTVGDLPQPRDGSLIEISTSSDMVRRAREGVMEFLLINHPLDCPICDQGGECDLQDQAIAYGRGGSRFVENKRAVEDKDMGPLIKTVMTRCIQCTRCVRFAAEIAGVEEIGLTGRGENARITTWLHASLTSELSGNMIDLCPVGALTAKPSAFAARSWEMDVTHGVDVMDALGSAIQIHARGPKVLRILPRVNDAVNEEWISDKARFSVDGLARQRLDTPYVRHNGRLAKVGWDEAINAAAAALAAPSETCAAIAGDLCCAEGMKASIDLMRALHIMSTDCRQDFARIGLTAQGAKTPRSHYLFNASVAGIDTADAILLIGSNPRREAPVLNARIRRAWLRGCPVALVGSAADLTYPHAHLGTDAADLAHVASGDFFAHMRQSARPMILVGQGAVARADGDAVLHCAGELARSAPGEDGWSSFNMLHLAAARVAGLDLGFLPGNGGLDAPSALAAARKGQIRTLLLLGADEIDTNGLESCTVIYVGSHGDAGAAVADIILPAPAYTEKSGTYVNTEGRVQVSEAAIAPKGLARPEWAIMRALSERMGVPLPYDDHLTLRRTMDLERSGPPAPDVPGAPGDSGYGREGALAASPLSSPVTRFHLTNPIARASKTMGQCAALAGAAGASQ